MAKEKETTIIEKINDFALEEIMENVLVDMLNILFKIGHYQTYVMD